ncbi:MAG TPA: PLP-dependent aminotransferase family protein [Polyangiales bacterium]
MTRPVKHWDLALQLDIGGADQPLFVCIARGLEQAVAQGRLGAGARVPGTRQLAAALGVHRNTVIAAYRELLAEGYLESRVGLGTFVAASLPESKPRRFGKPPPLPGLARTLGYALGAQAVQAPGYVPVPRGTLALYGGLPDVRLLPRAALARAYRRALADPATLSYGDPAGHPRLRQALASMLSATRGLAIGEQDLVVTRGSQMALALCARVLLSAGDVVAVEQHGYAPAWQALRAAGARLCPLPLDAHGLSVDALATLCETEPVRAVYLTAHHQYPTTVTLSASRRLALLALARRKRFAILEDDYDHEFHYEGRPILPLASADTAGSVVYIGTLSKVLAPGVRIGYVVAPAPLLGALVAQRFYLDRQGDQATEAAVAELFEDGEVQRHVRRARRVYRARRDLCAHLLARSFGDELSFRVPPGGMAFWIKARRGLPVERWLGCAQREGVLFQPGRLFDFEQRASPFLRLGFAGLDERELVEAMRRLQRARKQARG